MKCCSSCLVVVSVFLIVVAGGCASVSQQPDLEFEPLVADPAYAEGTGPVVLVDGAHFNFHTVDGRYAPFAKLLRRDGYLVRGLDEAATPDSLGHGDIYVVANAIAESDHKKWRLPNEPAFTAAEIAAIHDWVENGGSLFLIADHMPFPAAVEDLAAAFGLLFGNGYAFDASGQSRLTFTFDGGGLADHPITRGRTDAERVDSVHAFTGQAFRSERPVEPLLTLPSGSTLRLPVQAGKFKDTTAEVPAAGMLQGAVFRYGKGRIAVFGEAAMFSAQRLTIDDRVIPMGMNAPEAAQNPQLLLNVMHWLSGLIPE